MTPEEFKAKVQELIPGWDKDPEEAHSQYDALLEEALRPLGYGEGIDLVQDQKFWYA